MTSRIVNTLDEHTWRNFVDAHPQGNIFHTPEMFRVFTRARGHKPALWAVVGEHNTPLALMPVVQVTLQKNLLYPLTTRAVAYGGILSQEGADGLQGLEQLLEAYRIVMQGRFLFTELRNLADVSTVQPVLNACRYIYEDHMDYLVDLNLPEEQLWQNISKSGRQRLRHALSRGTLIEQINDRDEISLAYQQLQKVYRRVQVPLADISLFQAAYDLLAPRGMCQVFLARINDRCIGASFVLLYKGKMLAWYSGTDRNFNAYNPGELLKWQAFRWGKAHGYHQFDFNGAGKPGEAYGPRDFKAKFGGQLVNYGRNVCVHAPLRLQLSKLAYALARKASLLASPGMVNFP
jgi:serine/alanine adding enzyme